MWAGRLTHRDTAPRADQSLVFAEGLNELAREG